MKETIEVKLDIPEGVSVSYEDGVVCVKGPLGELKRSLFYPGVDIKVDDKITIRSSKATKREKKMIGTFRAHIKNMFKGVTEGHVYKLKVCSGHFPMSVSVEGDEFVVKNFFGEKAPRKLKIPEGVKVKVDGNDVIVESVDKELAGRTASDIEQLTRRVGFDKRIFQDGIYIYYKDGKYV
ncbi:50S ribosomal protein L6 [Candidatus Woesearchaeota archaeon]|nr:MAG: 50S ribosomal protein L6 [Candidatus Woesearchaeota archaeon]